MKNQLHELAAAGDVAALAAAIDRGDLDIDAHDHNGETPLMTALSAEHPEAATLLLDRGASITAADLGGNRALDYAFAYPEIIARIESMGGTSGRVQSLEFPYDRDDFEPGLAKLLARFRDGALLAEPHAEVVALLSPEPPPDLAALLHTWAHKPRSAFFEVGDLWIESRALCRAPDSVLAIVGRFSGVIIGSDPSGHVLVVVSWDDGDDRAHIDRFDDEGFADSFGSLADLGDQLS